MPQHSQYIAVAHVPLIKNPGLRVPRPVELPTGIHPLPESVTEYFVYPFTLEPHIITLESTRRSTIASHATRREAYLRLREEEKQRRERDALKKIAPGFIPHGTPLVPTKPTAPDTFHAEGHASNISQRVNDHVRSRSVMDDLVDQLAAMNSQ
ncbi:hypothetical protein BDQ17DRAFT_1275520 [Cyathus striatus]|nr:hypothetical protein BDQ17DRAFT_1275520 [Cyathus striatus]